MARKAITIGVSAMLLMIGGCGGGKEGAGNVAGNEAGTVTNAAESNVASPAPAPARDFTRYVGKYPFDEVDGRSWNDDPAVIAAITAAIPDVKVRDWVLEGEGPSSPIEQFDGRVLSWACEAHNCGPHKWTTMIDPATGVAEVCYFDEEADPKKSRWFSQGKEQARTDPCPEGEGK
ncbi:MAG: hypothetical protein AB7E05_10175 [Sphingobium sp.]